LVNLPIGSLFLRKELIREKEERDDGTDTKSNTSGMGGG
jgi:hypothetical protein